MDNFLRAMALLISGAIASVSAFAQTAHPLPAEIPDSLLSNQNWSGGSGLPGTNGDVRAMAFHDGTLFIGGDFSTVNGLPIRGIAMWADNGWTWLGSESQNGVDGSVEAIAVDDRYVYVGGSFRFAGETPARNIARWDRQNQTWESLGKGIGGVWGSAVLDAVLHDNQLYVGGRFVVCGTVVSVNIGRWDGSRWHRVGTGINDVVADLHVDGDYLYAGGKFTLAGDNPADRLARFDFTAQEWSGLQTGIADREHVIATVESDADFVYVAGRFDEIGGRSAGNVARWNKASGTWDNMDGGVRNFRKTGNAQLLSGSSVGPLVVHTIEMRGPDLFVGGDFDMVVSQTVDVTGGDNPRDMAVWKTEQDVWSQLPRTSSISGTTYNSTGVVKGSQLVGSGADFEDYSPKDNQSTIVRCFQSGDGDEIFIGGAFHFAGPFNVTPDVGVLPNSIELDPEAVFSANVCSLSERDTVWSPLGGGGFDGDLEAVAVRDSLTFVGGAFDKVGGNVVNKVGMYDRSSGKWSGFGSGVDFVANAAVEPSVRTLAVVGNIVYVGGRFDRAGNETVNGLAAWDIRSRTWSLPGGNTSFDHVYDILSDGERLFVGGENGIDMWDGSAWTRPGEQPNGTVYALELRGDTLFVGGEFDSVGTVAASNVAQYRYTADDWRPLAQGTTGPVYALEIWERFLYVGGEFDRAGTRFGTTRIARWDPDLFIWESVGGDFRSEPDNVVRTITSTHHGMYVGGEFSIYVSGGSTSRANSIALYDGQTWHALGNGVAKLQSGAARVNALAVSDSLLHAGGKFHYAGGKPANRYAQWSFAAYANAVAGDRHDRSAPSAAVDSFEAALAEYKRNSLQRANDPDDRFWDDRFSPDNELPGSDDEVFALASDGESVVAGGAFQKVSALTVNGVALWNGVDWETLADDVAAGVNGVVFAVAISGDDIFVGGQFDRVGGIDADNIARFDRATRTWYPLGNGVSGDGSTLPFVSDILLDGSDVYVAGTFARAGGAPARSVAKWDGSSWNALGNGIDGAVNDMERFDGSLFVGGSFGVAGTSSANGLAFWDGSNWHAAGDGVAGSVNALATSARGLLIGGEFTSGDAANIAVFEFTDETTGTISSIIPESGEITSVRDIMVVGPRAYIAGIYSFNPDPSLISQRFDPGLLNNVAFNFIDTTEDPVLSPWFNMTRGVDGPVNALAALGDRVFVGGSFSRAGSGSIELTAANMALWDPDLKRWERAISASVLGTVQALTLKGFDLYAAGPFRQKGDPDNPLDAQSHLARLGSKGWHLVEGVIGGEVYHAFTAGNEIVAAGDFITTDGRIGVNIARWDASDEEWSALTPGSGVASQEDLAYVSAVAGDESRLYVGGDFNVVDTFETPHVACWERSSGKWRALGHGLNDVVRAVAVDEAGRVFAGGDFMSSGTDSVSHVAMWDGDSWVPLGRGVDGRVYALAVDGNMLYVGGKFYRAGNHAVANVAAWNIADSTWERLGPGLDSDFLPSVEALAVAKGKVFAGGMFDHSGSDSIKRVARWDGWKWTKLGSGTSWSVWSFAIRNGDVFVAGPFLEAGGKPSPYIGLWHDPTLSVEVVDLHDRSNVAATVSPNPVRSRAHIVVDNGLYQDVRLTIANIEGIEIVTLFEGRLTRRETSFEWRPGAGVPPGTYFVRLESGNTSTVKQVLLQ